MSHLRSPRSGRLCPNLYLVLMHSAALICIKMFLAVVGTRYSGKSQVRDYYVSVHGFLSVRIERNALSPSVSDLSLMNSAGPFGTVGGLSTPDINALPQMDIMPPPPHPRAIFNDNTLVFPSAIELLQYVTKNWQLNFVTIDLRTQELIKLFVRRPFFMLLSIDGPLTLRFMRSGEESLEKFVRDNDRVSFGVGVSDPAKTDFDESSSLLSLRDLVNIHVFNSFKTIPSLHKHLEELNVLDPERLRPGWDAYFMTLASLASQRSNCMKRRVGAVLVRENRVVSTG
ncbi:hypothetical protein H2248_001144 [Termitomyces sp. 'cryptogamus']|nr:hypothetical protein H2248_001144 [Termitomyces sp. 'cryptogamus']